jgi:hypothetical protein
MIVLTDSLLVFATRSSNAENPTEARNSREKAQKTQKEDEEKLTQSRKAAKPQRRKGAKAKTKTKPTADALEIPSTTRPAPTLFATEVFYQRTARSYKRTT